MIKDDLLRLKRLHPVALLLCLYLPGVLISSENPTDRLIMKLGADNFKAREQAKKELLNEYPENPSILDVLYKKAYDKEDDMERVLNARELVETIVSKHLFVERGAIGIAFTRDMKVYELVADAPAAKAGILHQWTLISLAGKKVEGLQPGDIYKVFHNTRPGTKLPMTFIDVEGKQVTVHPVVAPRSQVREDENLDARRKQYFHEWRARKEAGEDN